MIEKTLKEVQDERGLGFDESRIAGAGQLLQEPAHITSVGNRPIEVETPGHIPFHEQAIAIRNQLPQQPGARHGFSGEVVYLEELWQWPIRVEQIAVLVGPIHGASPQGAQQLQ